MRESRPQLVEAAAGSGSCNLAGRSCSCIRFFGLLNFFGNFEKLKLKYTINNSNEW